MGILAQIDFARTMYQAFNAESVHRRGRELYSAGVEQSTMLYYTFKQVGCIFESLERPKPLSSMCECFLEWTPSVLGILSSFSLPYQLEEKIPPLTRLITPIALSIATVATAVFLLMNRWTYSVAILGTITIYSMKQKGCFSSDTEKTIEMGFLILSNIDRLGSDSRFKKYLAAIEIASVIQKLVWPYLSSFFQEKKVDFIDATQVRFEEAMDKIGAWEFVVDPTHIGKHKVLPDSALFPTYDRLIEATDLILKEALAIDIEANLLVILDKLRQDDHWNDSEIMPAPIRRLYQDFRKVGPNVNPDEYARLKQELLPHATSFVKEGIVIFVNRIRATAAKRQGLTPTLATLPGPKVRQKMHKMIIEGVSMEQFKDVEGIVAGIAHFLGETKPVDQVDALLRLSIECGDYCGSGVIDVLEEVYSGLAGMSQSLGAEETVQLILRAKQLAFFDALVYFSSRIFPRKLIDSLNFHSPHSRNTLINIYGATFNFQTLGAENDEANAAIEGKSIYFYPLSLLVKRIFFKVYYTRFRIFETIIDAIKTKRLSQTKVQEWFNKYLTDTEGYQLETTEYSNIRYEIYDIDTGHVSGFALLFMLWKMGILGVKKETWDSL